MTDLDAVVSRAATASSVWRGSGAAERARWLRATADALDAHRAELVGIAAEETRLETERLSGEVGRTSGQLRLFADVVEDGAFLEAIVDDADEQAVPRRPELRRMLIGIGPVAVFSASNFPFAFSVCGGDTAAAWAAGNAVVVKAHSGHPRLSRRTAAIAAEALRDAGAPDGSIALVEGRSNGEDLVRHPAIQAVGFTGSVAGGRALFDLAAARPDPIPFHGELGSINPVVLTAAAVAARGPELAAGLLQSFTLGVGQFCTKPGVVFVPRGGGFEEALRAAAAGSRPGHLLTDRIAKQFRETADRLAEDPAVLEVFDGTPEDARAGARIVSFEAAEAAERPEVLMQECFGPMTALVTYSREDDLLRALGAVPGSLTATIHSEEGEDVASIVDILQRKAGRVLFAGWPTGVAVTWSQHHGGPWPATTSQHTSVGATAVRRFQRPLVFQDAPTHLLPEPLRDESLRTLPHRRNGVLVAPAG